jgi:protein-disulfide isomerase
MALTKKNLSLGLLIFLLGALVFNVFRYKQLATNYNTLALNYKALNDSITAQHQAALNDKVKLEKGQVFEPVAVVTTEGAKLQVPNQDKKAKMLVFSSSTCPNCEDYHPVLSDLAIKHDDIDIIVLEYDATPEAQKQVLKENDYKFAFVSTAEHVLDTLNIMYTPTTVILNTEHKVDTVLLERQDLKQLNLVLDKMHL